MTARVSSASTTGRRVTRVPYRYEIQVKGCLVCGGYTADVANTLKEATRLKAEVEASQDKDCGGAVIIVDTEKDK